MAHKFAAAYHVTRHYGGPEEGGWFYDYLDLTGVDVVLPYEDNTERTGEQITMEKLEARMATEFPFCKHMRFFFEDVAGENQTRSTPRYE